MEATTEPARLVGIEGRDYPRVTFSDGTKLFCESGSVVMAIFLDGQQWTLSGTRTLRRVGVSCGMLLTDFLAVLAYLEGKA